MTSTLKTANDSTFAATVMSSPLPVLVDFWSDSCMPCIAIGKSLEELAPKFAERALIVKVNAEEAIDTATMFGIRGLPHLLMMKGGKVVDQKIGNQSRATLESWLARHAV